MRFTLGVNYWPRLQGVSMWRTFDTAEIREDFARIAEIGMDGVRFFVRWDQFQPTRERLEPDMLDRFERFIALAAEAGLQTMPVLLCGHMSGVNFLPAWALGRDGRIGNLYSGPMVDAQIAFARSIATNLREDAAIASWDVGHQFSNVSMPTPGKRRTGGHETAPASEAEVAAWAGALKRAISEHSKRPVTAGTLSADVTEDRNIRLTSLAASLDFASMQGSSIAEFFSRDRLDAEAVPFLAMVAASFSHKPVMVTAVGVPTCPRNKLSLFERLTPAEAPQSDSIPEDDPLFASYACLTEDEAATYCTATLDRLHADGRLGVFWWCWSDYAGAAAEEPPFNASAAERSYGIIRADGTSKPIAGALTAFARQKRDVRISESMPMISGEYWYRTLPKSVTTVYEAFLREAAERRPNR